MATMIDADREIALNYVPRAARDAIEGLWRLDAALGDVVRRTTQPLIGQMRLTWWHERLAALDTGERLAEPVLQAVADHILGPGVSGAALGGLVDGWEVLLDAPALPEGALAQFAAERGERLFGLTALLLDGAVGKGMGARWALVDLAAHASPAVAGSARDAALATMALSQGPKALRVLARLAEARLRRPLEAMGAPLSRWEGLRAAFG